MKIMTTQLKTTYVSQPTLQLSMASSGQWNNFQAISNMKVKSYAPNSFLSFFFHFSREPEHGHAYSLTLTMEIKRILKEMMGP